MQQLKTTSASLLSVPSDVIQHHLICYLSRADLVVISTTCTIIRKIFLKWKLCLGEKKGSQAQFQSDLLNDIFRVGRIGQLVWFQKNLKYLSMTELNHKEQILVAFRGDLTLSSCNFAFLFESLYFLLFLFFLFAV